jgi:hypothetical protein
MSFSHSIKQLSNEEIIGLQAVEKLENNIFTNVKD